MIPDLVMKKISRPGPPYNLYMNTTCLMPINAVIGIPGHNV